MLCFDVLNDLISYDHDTGLLTWKPRPETDSRTASWNTRYAGAYALNTVSDNGYLTGRILNKFHFSHRVAWTLYHEHHPNGQIDHINGVKTDNRIGNLRVVDHFANCRNKKRYSDNTSGFVGVSKHSSTGKWQARMGSGPTRIHLGLFERIEDAVAARKAAELEHDYHQNHGRVLQKGSDT